MIIFRSSQVSVLKYYIFWSENATDILNKAHKNSIFLQENKVFKIFLMMTLILKNLLKKSVNIAVLVTHHYKVP